MVKVTIPFQNAGPQTVWAKLAAKLNREPTIAEAKAEVRRILSEARAMQAAGLQPCDEDE